MMTDDSDVLATALAWRAEGKAVAMATVVATWGSSPRPVGSRMTIDASGAMIGSVTSGCVEAAVVYEAQAALKDGRPRLLTYGVTEEKAWGVGLACGGTVRVFVAPLSDTYTASCLMAAIKARRLVAQVIDVETGHDAVVDSDGVVFGWLAIADVESVVERIRSDRSELIAVGGTSLFVRVHAAPRRLLIVGAVHIAQALATLGRMTGYDVVVIDPRAAFATEDRFPGVTLACEWPDEAFTRLGLDDGTAIVSLSHDSKIDDPALEAALRSPAFYVGALGSRFNQVKRRERLTEKGLTTEQIARLHGPVGLAIGALTPAEIAVSIMAEITAVRRGKAS